MFNSMTTCRASSYQVTVHVLRALHSKTIKRLLQACLIILTKFIIKIIKNTHKKDINCLKLTQKVKNIKNKYEKPLRRTYNGNPLRHASESFFGRYSLRRASRRTPQPFFKTMCVILYMLVA
ncbi:hypothetical protein HanLR1_Chr17g0678221 [Helianthus annuus]|nr:hypothetical protein HanLR1_Chr17g0678221 [Helianthus annuus]